MLTDHFNRMEEWRARMICTGKWFIVRGIGLALLVLCILAFVFAIPSCKPQQLNSSVSQQTSLVSERYDSAVSVVGDSANAALLLRCDSLGNVYLANFMTEQGKRLRLEVLLRGAQNQLDSMSRALSTKNAPPAIKPNSQPRNTPLLIDIDCKEDSFEVIVRGLRERIAYLEEYEQKEQVPVRYVPDYYKNCAKGFWTLLVVLLLAIAFVIYKNWTKIAAWALKVWAKFKF
jgi:hypothetical protein